MEQLNVSWEPQAGFTSVQNATRVKPDANSVAKFKVSVTPSSVTATAAPAAQAFALQADGLAESTPKKQLIVMLPV